MFATAILWARKLGPRPIKLANLGEEVQVASQTLYKIIEQHGPLTLSDCWKHASQMENHGLKSKRHMKMMLRWMRERRTVRLICKHGEDGKSADPNEREFLFTVGPPKIEREPRGSSQRDSAPPPAE
ncbi:hypothetical protein KC19_4G184300 [Ceratodon purpureus]|uniref:Uncharacterized protein n=1 Tax=Ceratodon purpureus TaxID=3225 RepID=A0A8T0ICL4_CERPU|nr:hypothetical protein KC19_4G184300 [Ceratodon purpureus]